MGMTAPELAQGISQTGDRRRMSSNRTEAERVLGPAHVRQLDPPAEPVSRLPVAMRFHRIATKGNTFSPW
jgi:hypothetical protein